MVPVAATVALLVVGVSAAAWFAGVDGTAGGRIAAVEPVTVEAAYGGEGALPGQGLPLQARVKNPNAVSLRVTKVAVEGLTTDKDGCTVGKGKVDPVDGLVLEPGEATVVVANVQLPASLPGECFGAKVTARLSLSVGLGS
jgi:hypothetical protein